MNKTLLVCLLAGLIFAGSVLFPMPVQAEVGIAPTSLSFGSVSVNTRSAAATIVVTNDGRHNVSITGVSSSLPEFIVTGPALPLTLSAHASASYQVVFLPNAAQSFSGSIFVSSIRHYGETSTSSIAVTGTGTSPTPSQTYLLAASTSSLSFGNALVGSSASQTMTVTNSGTGSVSIVQAAISGAGFTFSGCSGAMTLAAGQSLTLTVSFAPSTAGSATGSLSVVSNATNSPATIALSGTGVQAQISVIPASVSFGNVAVGVTNTQSFTIQNAGTANLSVTQAVMAGTGFTLSGLTVPLSVVPGGSSTFSVGFTPGAASSFTGSLTLVSNTTNSPLVVALAGTGVSPILQLTVTPASLSFGSITTGTSTTQSVTVTNSGNASVTLSQISESGAGFSVSGCTLPLTLAAGQSTSFNVTFDPATASSLSGSVTVTSNAANSPEVIPLSGAGTAPTSYLVSLSWTPSSSSYSGFNVYRGAQSGGPYSKINSSLIATPSYADTSVTAGDTYYYVATEVDTTGVESNYSSQVSAIVP